jgi:methylenetetrahydrofolate dehydrogenase (NADP+)/methenyltetrahydrofolate cyclohydrolase
MNKMKEYAAMRKAQLKEQIAQMEHPPSLLILQVGEVEASTRYIRNKIKDCEEVGISAVHYKADENITTEELMDFINERQSYFTGIIVQQPLPAHIDQSRIDAIIDPSRDMDGFHPMSHFNPATAQGIIDYLEWRNWLIPGLNVVVIGRSNIVGKPLARMLTDANLTVTLCHSYTTDIVTHCRNADIIICAVGQEKFLDCSTFNQPIIDVGINFDKNGKMCGDCYVLPNATGGANISPVPGGVGLLTRVALLENVVKAYEYR